MGILVLVYIISTELGSILPYIPQTTSCFSIAQMDFLMKGIHCFDMVLWRSPWKKNLSNKLQSWCNFHLPLPFKNPAVWLATLGIQRSISQTEKCSSPFRGVWEGLPSFDDTKLHSRSLTASFPLNIGHPKKKHVIFQPSMFRGELWVASLRVTGNSKGKSAEFQGKSSWSSCVKSFQIWADCLCPQPKPVGGIHQAQQNPRCLRWFQHYLQIRNRTFEPRSPKKMVRGSEKVCKKEEDSVMTSRSVCACFFLIRNRVFECCINHHMFKQKLMEDA